MAGFLAPTVGLYAPKGMIVLFTCAAIACLYAYVMVKGQRPAIPRALRLSILALAVWSIASLGWTVSFKLTWSLARTLRFILLGGVLFIAIATKLSPKGRPFVGHLKLVGFVLGVVLALVDIGTAYSISNALNILKSGDEWKAVMPGFGINNGITVLATLLWPILIYLVHQKRYRLAIRHEEPARVANRRR